MIERFPTAGPEKDANIKDKSASVVFFDQHPELVSLALSLQRRLADSKSVTVLPGEPKQACKVQKTASGTNIVYDPELLLNNDLTELESRLSFIADTAIEYDFDTRRKATEWDQRHPISGGLAARMTRTMEDTRVQRSLSRRLLSFGRAQLNKTLQEEQRNFDAKRDRVATLPTIDKALELYRQRALAQILKETPEVTDERINNLRTPEVDQLFEQLTPQLDRYLEKGGWEELEQMVEQIHAQQSQKEGAEQAGESESMSQLRKELEKILEQEKPGNPNSDSDSGIPPSESEETHTNPEKQTNQQLYEVKPGGSSKKPLTGYYRLSVKSYFDRQTKLWSKRKQLHDYNQAPSISEQNAHLFQTISGVTDTGLKSLPIPNGYAIDADSVVTSGGASLRLFQDQNGSYYIQANQRCEYAINYYKSDAVVTGRLVNEDLEDITSGSLTDATEQFVVDINASAEAHIAKAIAIREYVVSHHYYPGGGDLEMANALQYKMSQVPADEFIKALDESEYLECKSANTLFIALARKAGIPARLNTGYRVSTVVDGKAIISSDDGHAWSEVWNDQSQQWTRIDATPAPKPEDKSKQKKEDSQERGEDADDGGMDFPNSTDPAEGGEGGEASQSDESGQGGEPGDDGTSSSAKASDSGTASASEPGVSEASDDEISRANKDMDSLRQKQERMVDKQRQMKESTNNSESFSELEKLKKEVDEGEMTEAMKEKLRASLEQKQQDLKKEIIDKLEQMLEEGFIDQKEFERSIQALEKNNARELDKAKEAAQRSMKLFEEYKDIQDEVMPLVRAYYEDFERALPKTYQMGVDQYGTVQDGEADLDLLVDPEKRLLLELTRPKTMEVGREPMFLSTILVDISGSMYDAKRLPHVRKLLIFLCELFDLVSKLNGPIKFAVHAFSTHVYPVKDYDEQYSDNRLINYGPNKVLTIKARIMDLTKDRGDSTKLVEAVEYLAKQMNLQYNNLPNRNDWATSVLLLLDGDDDGQREATVRRIIESSDPESGLGQHSVLGLLMGDERLRRKMATVMGDDNVVVANSFDDLIAESMAAMISNLNQYFGKGGGY